MALLGILVVSGLVVAALVSSVAYLNSAGNASRGRLRRTVLLGGVSFAGFLVPHVFSAQLSTAYFRVIKPRPVAVSPVEWVAVNLAFGFVSSVALVLLSLAGGRYRTPERRSSE